MKKILLLIFLFNPFVMQALDLDVGGEWLYWEAEQSQMDVVSTFANQTLTPVTPDFHYTDGYRVWVDLPLDNCWRVGGVVTHLPSRASVGVAFDPALLSTQSIALNGTLYPLYEAATALEVFSSSAITWNLNLYYVDVTISRLLSFGHYFELEPYFGLRGFWMRQKIGLTGNSPEAPGGAIVMSSSLKEKFSGIGLQGGVEGSWEIGWGFSLIGEFGGSLVYSRVKSRGNITSTQAGAPLVNISFNEPKAYKSFPTVDSGIGLRYTASICDFPFELHALWENHIFFHTNHFTLTNDGNLTTQGLTLGGSVGF